MRIVNVELAACYDDMSRHNTGGICTQSTYIYGAVYEALGRLICFMTRQDILKGGICWLVAKLNHLPHSLFLADILRGIGS